MSYKLIPETYQEDSFETRKENPQLKYARMYDEKYVDGLIQQIKDLSDVAHLAIKESKNRGTQRCAIPIIRKALETLVMFRAFK